ncbi:type II secretion system GspH family protein [Shewanella eurypsychrophilus]|uniref:Type II secretion system GspH family protein n=1 Tax=Shewanella eurypsychrophilus TaxID=2593656 RepID=A0ABX6V8Q2_9GAMM|nr:MULTISPECIES: type II secretion system protein [Shewanella]QFU23583.1 prepilin-type N-terminal cleavage/methylation domain-containing protein [Shewanella sp. YLB-09]QPG58807.1 type II secretion system GspH family protein [Shewanella eurypsychrophilus]
MDSKKRFNSKGFTLIELVVVIVILGILAVSASSKFINFSVDAKDAVLQQFSASVKGANSQMYILSQLSSYRAQPVSGRGDLTDVDVDGDGIFETRLKCGYLDNTDVAKRLDYSDDSLGFEFEGVDKIYFGFGQQDIKASQCYFMYQQAYGTVNPNSCDQDDPDAAPVYEVIITGC